MFQRLLVEEQQKEKVKALEFGNNINLHLFLINIFISSLEVKESRALLKLALKLRVLANTKKLQN